MSSIRTCFGGRARCRWSAVAMASSVERLGRYGSSVVGKLDVT